MVQALKAGVQVYGATAVEEEVLEWLPVLAQKRKLDEALLIGSFRMMPIYWKTPVSWAGFKEEALRRIGHRDPDDWPSLALALALQGTPKLTVPKTPSSRLSRVALLGSLRLRDLGYEFMSPMGTPGRPLRLTPKSVLGMFLASPYELPIRISFHLKRFPRMAVALWTRDKDFAEVGVPLVRTGDLLRLLGH